MDKETLINLISSYFDNFSDTADKAMVMVSQLPEVFSPTSANMVSTIISAIMPVAYVLATLFFIIDLCNKTLMFETSNYEVVVKLLLRYVLAKVIIDNCRGIMIIIFSAFSGIATNINAAGNLMLGDAAKQALIDQINVMNGGFAGINYLSFYLKLIPSMLVIFIVTLLVSIIVLGRMFEIFIYTAVAPLPVATLAGEMSHDTFKKFMQGYISVCLQGVIIIIAFQLFGSLTADAFSSSEPASILTYLMTITVFALTLFKSGTWAKQIVGIA